MMEQIAIKIFMDHVAEVIVPVHVVQIASAILQKPAMTAICSMETVVRIFVSAKQEQRRTSLHFLEETSVSPAFPLNIHSLVLRLRSHCHGNFHSPPFNH